MEVTLTQSSGAGKGTPEQKGTTAAPPAYRPKAQPPGFIPCVTLYSSCTYFSVNNCTSHRVLFIQVIETQPKLGKTTEECPWEVYKTR